MPAIEHCIGVVDVVEETDVVEDGTVVEVVVEVVGIVVDEVVEVDVVVDAADAATSFNQMTSLSNPETKIPGLAHRV